MAKKERQLPDVLEHDFIITDESVNRYGWRLLVAGIDLTGFGKNPVCCVQHDTWMIPVGKWKNLRVEGQELRGTAEFDPNDEEAVKLYWKYKDGYMNAVSLHVIPLEESESATLLLPGQKAPTLTKSEMLEISLVTVPGQRNAVKLSTPDGGEYKLHLISKDKEMAKDEKTVEQLTAELEGSRKLNASMLVGMHKARGVVQDGEATALEALALTNFDTVKQMLEGRKAPDAPQGSDAADVKADALVKLHFERGAVGADEQAVWKGAAKLDFDGTSKILAAKPGKDGLQTFMQGMGDGKGTPQGGANERDKWTYLEFYKKDPDALLEMEKKEPEKYRKLVADFEAESTKMGIGTAKG